MSTTQRALALALAIAGLTACAADGPITSPDAAAAPSLARAAAYSSWSMAVPVEAFNTAALEGCPYSPRDGNVFFFASDRLGGLGGTDIYVSTRASADAPWSAPVNLGAPVNSPQNDFCPTLARDGHTFFFASARPGGCGGDDIYVTRIRGGADFEDPSTLTFDAPQNLGCDVNSAGNEAGPFPIPQPGVGPVLYFSSTRAGGPSQEAAGVLTGDADIYMAESYGGPDGPFAPAQLVPGVNSTANDIQPNVSRDALELFFASNRTGTMGGTDIYVATRTNPTAAWSQPVNLGPNVNSAAAEARPSLSWDGTTLYFGSTRRGSSDIFVTTRERLTGRD